MSDGDADKIYKIESGSIDQEMIRHLLDALEDDERIYFLMHQVLVHCVMFYKTPQDFIDGCHNAKKALPFDVPPRFAMQLINLCKSQSVIPYRQMMTEIIARIFIMGVEYFATTIALDEKYKEMHKKMGEALGGIFGSDMESKTDRR